LFITFDQTAQNSRLFAFQILPKEGVKRACLIAIKNMCESRKLMTMKMPKYGKQLLQNRRPGIGRGAFIIYS